MKAVLLTGSETRHSFFRLAVAQSTQLDVVASFCESDSQSLANRIETQESPSEIMRAHAHARATSEEDFFGPFNDLARDYSNPYFIDKGAVNTPEVVDKIMSLKPDVIASYGCSLIREPLISAFEGRFINVHLGLSPYYRGAGTNFWALHNNQPECFGATFMYIDGGIDTGAVIHQIRARIMPGDTPHMIGNRLIADMVAAYRRLLEAYAGPDSFETAPDGFFGSFEPLYYKRADFTEQATRRMLENFKNGLVESYLSEQVRRQERFPIFENGVLS